MPEDKDAVLSLAQMQVKETLPHLDFRRDLAEATFERCVKHAHPTGFVAVQDDEVIGYLLARLDTYSFSSGVFVSQEVLYVRPDKRGTRAAVHLIKEFVQWGEIVGAREWLFGISNGFQPDRTARLFERLTGAQRVGYHLRLTR
jgi:GNAT superfamily N-acetyltransferase